MDFSIPAELAADAKKIEDFVADEIIPLETDPAHYDAYGNIDLALLQLSLIHISEPTRRTPISYAVFCLKKKNI